MNRETYLKIKNDQKADNLPVIFYYAKMKRLTGVNTLEDFGVAFHKWIISLMRHPADGFWLRRVVELVDRELDKHFNVVNGI